MINRKTKENKYTKDVAIHVGLPVCCPKVKGLIYTEL